MTQPIPSNPITFTILAGLIGVVIGAVISPTVERLYKKLRRKDR